MATVYISLGSNVGDRQGYLSTATQQIAQRIGKIQQTSSILETAPWGVKTAQENYLNQIIVVETALQPLAVLVLTQAIEKELGRVAKGNYAPRTIDLDILYYDDLVLTLPNLQIPHPLAHLRKFILDNMLEVAPDWKHPKEQKTQKELYQILLNPRASQDFLETYHI